MKVTVISDIHGNLPALEKVVKLEADTELFINLGDVVNYGPWSNECVDFICSLDNCVSLIGNHEEYFIKGSYPHANELVKLFFNITYPSFTKLNTILDYNIKYEKWGWKFTHTIGDRYIFPDTNVEINGNIFIGHSHKQFIKSVNGNIICNPGSVGQNRSCFNLINYAVLNTEHNSVELKTIEYNVNIVLNEMEEREYPKECLDYYLKMNGK